MQKTFSEPTQVKDKANIKMRGKLVALVQEQIPKLEKLLALVQGQIVCEQKLPAICGKTFQVLKKWKVYFT